MNDLQAAVELQLSVLGIQFRHPGQISCFFQVIEAQVMKCQRVCLKRFKNVEHVVSSNLTLQRTTPPWPYWDAVSRLGDIDEPDSFHVVFEQENVLVGRFSDAFVVIRKSLADAQEWSICRRIGIVGVNFVGAFV
jgi:hypothetical protein